MSFKKILSATFFACLLFISSSAFAQFEGQVTLKLYGDDDQGNSKISTLNLYATSQRIILKGEEQYSFMDGAYDASGLLIRNDKLDFIILMGENEALQFTKSELEGVFDMFAGLSGDDVDVDVNDNDINANFTYTNKTRTIKGYDCTELLITNDENDNTVSIWLTSGIDINWGMLAEPWKNVPGDMRDPAQRLTQEFKSKNFPMLIEVHEDGATKKVMEVSNVNKSAIAKAMVEIPPNTEIVGLSEIMFKMMMNSNR